MTSDKNADEITIHGNKFAQDNGMIKLRRALQWVAKWKPIQAHANLESHHGRIDRALGTGAAPPIVQEFFFASSIFSGVSSGQQLGSSRTASGHNGSSQQLQQRQVSKRL